MLLGIWKNIEDLETHLSLPELQAVLSAGRDQEHRRNKFMAALKGINLDEHSKEDTQERFDKIERRAKAKLAAMRTGKSVDETESVMEHDDMGLDLEIEE